MILALAAAIAAAPAPAANCPDVVTPQAFVCRALQASNSGNLEAAAQAFEHAAGAQTDEAQTELRRDASQFRVHARGRRRAQVGCGSCWSRFR